MGHFLTARFTKMKVEEFGIGIPPRAKKLFSDKKWTDYTLNWLPIGWFVRIKGEDSSSIEAGENDSFSAKKWWARSLVLIAWVAMNFLLGWIIFTFLFFQGTSPLAVNYLLDKGYNSYFLPSVQESLESWYIIHDWILLNPMSWSTGEKQWIKAWDILVKIDGKKVLNIDEVIEKIKTNSFQEFTIKRSDWEEVIIWITPNNWKINTYLNYLNHRESSDFSVQYWLLESMNHGFSEMLIISRITLDFLGKTLHDLISPEKPEDRELAKEMLAWPIGMWAGMVELVQVGFTMSTLLLMIAFLSVNLWVLNILPFPALDGGRLFSTTLVTCISFFTQKKQTLQKFEQTFHALWMLLLIALSLLIAFHDILKL